MAKKIMDVDAKKIPHENDNICHALQIAVLNVLLQKE